MLLLLGGIEDIVRSEHFWSGFQYKPRRLFVGMYVPLKSLHWVYALDNIPLTNNVPLV
jgi:hypothetical protein